MDKFLEELRFPAWKRALAARAGQQYVLQLNGGSAAGDLDNATLRIVTSDLRGKSELELPLSGRGVLAKDGDGGVEVTRSARPLDDHTVEITERFPRDRDPYSVCTRTLTPDGAPPPAHLATAPHQKQRESSGAPSCSLSVPSPAPPLQPRCRA